MAQSSQSVSQLPRRYPKARVVAEIGCNHKGSMEIAKELIRVARQCKSRVVKFQKRNPRELLSPEQYHAPHPVPENAYGPTYGAHREALEFTQAQHAELKAYCEKRGMVYSTSVWDLTSAREIIELDPVLIKVPSACNNHLPLLQALRDHYRGEVHVSVGMTTRAEEAEMVRFFEEAGAARERLVLYACTSGYPVPANEVALLEILRLRQAYTGRVKEFGFSNHYSGICLDIAAYTLGAVWFERHFTLNRTWKGTDHAASLEPAGLCKLIRDLNETQLALRYKTRELLPIELPQREKLKYRPPGG